MSKRRIFTTNPRDPDRWVGFGLAIAGVFVVAFLLAESFGFVPSSDSRRPDAAAAGTDCRQSSEGSKK